jgi:hypothetical protein
VKEKKDEQTKDKLFIGAMLMETSNQPDETVDSNLSLPSVTSSFLKQAKLSHKRQTSHGHYSCISNEDGDKEESISPSTIPIKEVKVLKKNPFLNNHGYSSKIPKKRGLRALLSRKSWPNPFIQGG